MMWPLFFVAGLVLIGGVLGAGGATFAALRPYLIANPARQLQMANLIYSRFRSAGFPVNLALAAVVNAYFESRLDPSVVAGRQPWGSSAGEAFAGGAHENSVGLFQLNAAPGAAGEGMSVRDRQNPSKNIARIIQIVKGPAGNQIRSHLNSSVGTLTYMFTTDIERPADRARKGAERQNFAEALFETGRSGGRTF
jgi:hypothetical protein